MVEMCRWECGLGFRQNAPWSRGMHFISMIRSASGILCTYEGIYLSLLRVYVLRVCQVYPLVRTCGLWLAGSLPHGGWYGLPGGTWYTALAVCTAVIVLLTVVHYVLTAVAITYLCVFFTLNRLLHYSTICTWYIIDHS